MLRRTALKLLSASPFAIGKVGQNLFQHPEGKELLSPTVGGAGYAEAQANNPIPCVTDPVREFQAKATGLWLKANPDYLAELRSSIHAETHVGHIDPDLMVSKSYSMAARIYYQKQRMVDRQVRIQLGEEVDRSLWRVHDKWFTIARKALGFPR